jgi:hypothetical protein
MAVNEICHAADGERLRLSSGTCFTEAAPLASKHFVSGPQETSIVECVLFKADGGRIVK